MFIVSALLLITRNIWLIRYGTRDVERNKYGITLDCFVAEQYKLLVACYDLSQQPRSRRRRKILLSLINDYNKKIEKYSKILRVPITEIESTSLIEKLTSGDGNRLLDELQNFVYVRELVVRTNEHDIGDVTGMRELDTMRESTERELNAIITRIRAQNLAEDDPNTVMLSEGLQRLIRFVETGETPSDNERFELKFNLITSVRRLGGILTNQEIESFSKNVTNLVDSLGKKSERKIVGVLAVDDMIDLR